MKVSERWVVGILACWSEELAWSGEEHSHPETSHPEAAWLVWLVAEASVVQKVVEV